MKNTRVMIAGLVLVVAAIGVFVYQSRTKPGVPPANTAAPAVSAEEARVQEHLKKLTDEMRQEMQHSDGKGTAPTNVEDEYNVDGLVLLTTTLRGDRTEEGSGIVGTVVNRRNQTLSNVEVSFKLYDKSGAEVGSAFAKTNHLEAGAQWNFKAATVQDTWSSFKLVKLTGR